MTRISLLIEDNRVNLHFLCKLVVFFLIVVYSSISVVLSQIPSIKTVSNVRTMYKTRLGQKNELFYIG